MAMRPHSFGTEDSNPPIGPDRTDILRADGHRTLGRKQNAGRSALQWDICPRCAWPGEKDTYKTNAKVPNKTRSSGSCYIDNSGQCKSLTLQHYTEKAKQQVKQSQGMHRHCIRSVTTSDEDQVLDTKPVRLQAAPSVPSSVQHGQHHSGIFQRSSLNGSDVTRLQGAEDKKPTLKEGHLHRTENPRPSSNGTTTCSVESAASTSTRVKRTRRPKETKLGCSFSTLSPDSADSPASVSQKNSRHCKEDRRMHNEGGLIRLPYEEEMLVSDFKIQRGSPSASSSPRSMSPHDQYGIKLKSVEVNQEEEFLFPKGHSGPQTHSEHSKEKLRPANCEEAVASEHDDLMPTSDTWVHPQDSEETFAGTRGRKKVKTWKRDLELAQSLTSSLFPEANPQQSTSAVETEIKLNERLSRGRQQEEGGDEEESSADEWALCLQRKQRKVCDKIKEVHLRDGGERTTIVATKVGNDKEGLSVDRVVSGRSSFSETDEPSSSSDGCLLGNEKLMEQHVNIKKNGLNFCGSSAGKLGQKGGIEKRESKVHANMVTKEGGKETELEVEEMGGKKHTRNEDESEEEGKTLEEEPEKIALPGKKEEEKVENEEEEVVMELDEAKKVSHVKAESDDDKVDMEKESNRDLNQEESEEESEDNSDRVELLIVKEVEKAAEDSTEEDEESADSEKEEGMAKEEQDFIENRMKKLKKEAHSPSLKSERCQSSIEREIEDSSEIHVDKDLSEGDQESSLRPKKEKLEGSEDENGGSEDAESDDQEDEYTEEAKSKRNSESASESTTASHNAAVLERNTEDDAEQEDIKVAEEEEKAECNLISSGSPTRERKSWLQRFGCLTSCLFPGMCRKRASLRRSSQDSLQTLPELYPVETTLELAAATDEQSQKSFQEDESCNSGSPPPNSYLQDKQEYGTAAGTEDLMEESEASNTESEGMTKKGRSLEKEDFDGFYD
ncbi:uncharacterized protein LOC144782918 [Lissotriton helveticus]